MENEEKTDILMTLFHGADGGTIAIDYTSDNEDVNKTKNADFDDLGSEEPVTKKLSRDDY